MVQKGFGICEAPTVHDLSQSLTRALLNLRRVLNQTHIDGPWIIQDTVFAWVLVQKRPTSITQTSCGFWCREHSTSITTFSSSPRQRECRAHSDNPSSCKSIEKYDEVSGKPASRCDHEVTIVCDPGIRTPNFRVPNDVLERGSRFEWKALGQCSKGDSCSFSHEPLLASGNRGSGQRRKGRSSSPASHAEPQQTDGEEQNPPRGSGK